MDSVQGVVLPLGVGWGANTSSLLNISMLRNIIQDKWWAIVNTIMNLWVL
jgi:hypothetical protein